MLTASFTNAYVPSSTDMRDLHYDFALADDLPTDSGRYD